MIKLPITTFRIGGVARIGCLSLVAAGLGGFFVLLQPQSANALALGVELPVADTVAAPLTQTVNNVTEGLGVSVGIQNTPSTIGAAVTPTSSGSTPLLGVDVGLPAPVASLAPTVSDTVQQLLPASAYPTSTESAAPSNVAAPEGGSSTSPQVALASATTDPPPNKTPVHRNPAQPILPTLGYAGFFSALPSALQNLAKGLAGNSVDNFPAILMTDFILAMVILSAGLSGKRYQEKRATN